MEELMNYEIVMMTVNPGAGAVQEATLAHAEGNVARFVDDLDLPGVAVERDEAHDSGGRFGFVLVHEGHRVEVTMPGLPLDRVRYVGDFGQDIWDFPRLYVNGSSWVWGYGLGIARAKLCGES